MNKTKYKKKDRYYHNKYTVVNKDKYMGDPTKVEYRSKWEFHFMQYCDNTPSIKRWGSECVYIPYIDGDGTIHKYFPDFYIEKVSPTDLEMCERIMIEIKPENQIHPDFVDRQTGFILAPEQFLKKTTAKAYENYEYQLRTYQKNIHKWAFAKEWCEKQKISFIILNENYLIDKKIMM